MSQKRTIELTCPMCGKPAPFTLWDSVNNVLNPELEEQLLKNTFALFPVPIAADRIMWLMIFCITICKRGG